MVADLVAQLNILLPRLFVRYWDLAAYSGLHSFESCYGSTAYTCRAYSGYLSHPSPPDDPFIHWTLLDIYATHTNDWQCPHLMLGMQSSLLTGSMKLVNIP